MTSTPHTLTIRNANVLDAAAGALMGERNLHIAEGRIQEISTGPVSAGDVELDLKGRTLMPGLCDAHVHVFAATASFPDLMRWSTSYATARASQILSDMLMRGFTTVRDCGGADYGLAQAIEEGYLVGPRINFCGHALSQSGGHGDMRGPNEEIDGTPSCVALGRKADGVPEVRRACREEIRKGAHFIKIMASGGVSSPTDRISSTQFAEEEIIAAVEEAEAAETYVAAHIYTARAANRVLKCGVRSIEHGNLIDDTTIDLLLEKDAYLVPTMSTHAVLGEEGVAGGMPKHMCDKVFEIADAARETHAHAHSRGVKMVYGTDLLGPMHKHQLLEFRLRGEFQPPADVIRGATSNAAELLQMDGEIGAVAVGALADLIAVPGNPLVDLNLLQDPDRYLDLIVKDGRIFKQQL